MWGNVDGMLTMTMISPSSISNAAVYTSVSHVAGSDGDYETVLYTVQQ